MKPKFRLSSSVIISSIYLMAAHTQAATLTWDANGATALQTDGAGTWLNPNQWWDGGANVTWSNATPDNAIIGVGGTGGTITLGAVSAGTVSINNFTGTYTLSGTSLSQTGGITVGASAGDVTISSPTLISGAGGLTMAGAGRLSFSGTNTNTFSGQLSIQNGELYTTSVNNNGANGVFGNSALPVILGASGQTGRLSVLVDAGVSTNKGFTLATGGTGEIRFGNLTSNFVITNADRPLTLSGTIGGSGNFVKLGGAAVVLSANNGYSGTTTVNEGQLRLNHATALPGGIAETGGSSALTINGNGTSNVGATIGLTSTSGDFKRGLGTGIDQFQIPGGISGFDAFGSARQVIVNNDPAFELQWGIPTFNPSELLLGYHSVTANNTLTLQNKIDLNGSTRTVRVNAATATLSNEIRSSSGTAGLTKNGAGTLVLSGANTYNGPTTVNAGTLTIGNAATFANTSRIVLNGTSRLEVTAADSSLAKLVTGGGVPFGTFLRYSSQAQTAAGPANGPGTILGTVEINLTNVNPDYTLNFGSGSTFQNLVTATYNSPITLSGDASLLSNTAVFTLGSGGITASTSGTKTLALTGTNTGANTIGGVIGNGSGTIAVAKTGTGAWTLTGANTYSGATTASAGTLTLSGTDGSIASSAVMTDGGTLTLSNTGAANNGNRLSDSLAFTMGGGTFNFNNDASANNFSESAGTLTLVGGANTVALQQAAVGQTSTLTFAGLSRTVGALNFSGAGLGAAVNPRSKITFTSAPTLADGIIGPWATINGTDYATLIGNDVVAYGGPMTDLTRQSSGTKVIPNSPTTDVRIIEGTGGSAANLTLAATTTTIDTLLHSISGGTGATTVSIGASETLRVNSINMVSTAGALTLGVTANTGTLAAGTAGGNLLLINNSTNNMTVNSVIANNTSTSSLTKDGSGTVILNGTNTYNGGTIINAGTLNLVGNTTTTPLGSSSGVTFAGNSTLSLYSFATSMSLPTITVNGGVIATIDLGGGGTGTAYSIPSLTGSGTFSATNSGGGQGKNITFGSLASFTGVLQYSAGGGTSLAFNVPNLSDVAASIRLAGTTTSIPFAFNYTGSAPLVLDNRWFELAGTTGSLAINNNASVVNTPLTINTNLLVTAAGNKSLTFGGTNAGVSTFAGNIADGPGSVISLSKGTGTWALGGTNTYSGLTTITSGTLTFLGSPAMSPNSKIYMTRSTAISLKTDDAGTVNLGNEVEVNAIDTSSGIVSTYTVDVRNNGGATTGSTIVLGLVDFHGGAGNYASSRNILVTGDNGYRLQVGDVDMNVASASTAAFANQGFRPLSAPLTITGIVKQIDGNTGNTTANKLYLGGTMPGNLVSGVIANPNDFGSNPNAQPLNVVKGEASEWTLSNTNTYTGTTTVSAGTLRVNSPGSLHAGSAVAVNGTSTIGGNGTIGGSVTLAGGANLSPGASAGTLSIGGNLDISAPAASTGKLFYELDAIAASDKIVVTGTLTIGTGALGLGDFSFTDLGGLQTGTYTLISAANITGTLDPAALTDLSRFLAPDAESITLRIAGNDIVLDVVLDDYDNDGTPNRTDSDDDNDGFPDVVEIANGSDPLDENSVPANAALFTVDNVTQYEGNSGSTNFVFTATYNGNAIPGGFPIGYATADGTAISPSDYAAQNGIVNFTTGNTGETATITVVGATDSVPELDETFAVNLGDGATVASGTGTILDDDRPIITEIMYDPSNSGDSQWEWVEVHNPSTIPLDLSGWVFDDDDGTPLVAANIAAGTIAPGGSAILYNSTLAPADFTAAWGPGINLVPVTNFPGLNNGSPGCRIGLWRDIASYNGGLGGTFANTYDQIDYGAANFPAFQASPGGKSIYLTDISITVDNADGNNWALSGIADPTPVNTGYSSANLGGNTGEDTGSPGIPGLVANDDTGTTDEDTVLTSVDPATTLTLLANDLGILPEVTAFDALSTLGATVSVNANGTFTYDPTAVAAFQSLDQGDNVVDTFTYTISDTHPATSATPPETATVTITVNGVNDVPQTATVTAITRKDANPSNAASVRWDVAFSAPVTGLTASNLSLVETGISGSAITDVSPGTGNDWVVTASNTGGCGTLGLDLVNDTGTSIPITNAPFEGEVYAIDTVAPVISCAKQIVATAPASGSAVVSYAPSAYDECEGVIPVVCDPPSGSSFGVGNHVVECTATDSAGNVGTASFNVVVLVQQPVNSERTLEGVSVRGDDAEGTGVAPGATILAINNAFLNNGGDVVFDASLQGNGANNSAVFHRPAGGTPAPVAVKGASFGAGSYGIFSHLSLNDADDIGFQSLTSGNLPGHFTGPGAGPVANSARRLGASPSGGVYNGLYQPALASNGELLTPAALLLGNGGVTSLNDSVITSSAGTVVAREGSPSGIGAINHGQFLARVVASDADGRYAFPSLISESPPTGGNAGIFVGQLGGSPTLAVRKGDAAAGTPGTFSSFLGESVNSDGEIALRAFAIGGGITAADNEGIWTNSGNASAPPVLVAREGDVAPCIAGGMVAFSSFGTIYMGDDGSVCFLAYLKDSDAAPFAMVNASNDASIWLWRNGALDLIVREGDLANSTDGAVVGRIVDFDSNGDADGGNGIAYSVEFAPISGDTTSRTNQAVYVDRGGEDLAPVLVLRRGDKFTVGEDEVDVLSLRISSAQAYTPSGSTGGFGRAINGDGDVLLNVGFTGSKSGIFVLGTPPPP